MEDIRSNPEEESLESPEAGEEMETLDEATHEPGAQIEQTGDIQTAEAIDASISELAETTNEVTVDDLPDEVVVGTTSVSMEAPDPGPHPPPELEEEESIHSTAPTEMPLEMDTSDSVEAVGLKWYQPTPDEDESAMVKGTPESAEQAETPGVAVTDAERLGKRDSEIEATPINIPEEPPPDEEEEPVQE